MTIDTQCLIIGAGIAGLVAAQRLQSAGLTVTVVDKGRGVGGRMATRRLTSPDGAARIDHGAQYFTNYDPQFTPMLAEWLAVGIVRKWSNGFHASDGTPHFNQTPRYVGTDGMTTIPKYLARNLDVYTGVTITTLRWEGAFAAAAKDGRLFSAESLILTPPVPQSLALIDSGNVVLPRDLRHQLAQIEYDPCFAVLATLGSPSRLPPPGGVWPVHPEPISWIADNQQKGVSDQPAVTIHAGPQFSRDHFDDDPDAVANRLIAAADALVGADVLTYQVQRWRYSIPVQMFPARFAAIDQPGKLLFAGDAFAGPRVEGAAMSGLAAADALLAA
ncbi:MAG: FAD-dependent oxidoreductase [Anaerolineae bacterium]|nr:FAD-dependent oxidoreductase [Anaerolineae bacterium]